jgi:HPt (histidine-containing phosphotransfer) domain-containing protein
MSEETNKLREKIARGEFRFADTLKLKHLEKVEASKQAKELLKGAGVLDSAKLYAYVASLEKRLEALEELVEYLRCQI